MLAPFHGVKLATTPSGRRIPNEWVLGRFEASTSPLGRNTQLAACSRVAATRSCWKVENGMVLPVSRARISAISSRRRRTISAALRKNRAFSTGGVSAQAGNAALAAPIATLASSAPQLGAWA